MSYVLVVLLYYGGFTHTFDTKAACELARDEVIKQYDAKNITPSFRAAFCTPQEVIVK